jgi:tetratricopeptide (TPR) repeat protein
VVELWSRPRRRLITLQNHWIASLAAATLSIIAGCASMTRDIERGRMAYHVGDFATAQAELGKVARSRSSSAPAARLDLAMTEIAAGNSAAAIKTLRELRDEFDQSSASDVGGEVVSILTDDNSRRYRPAAYELVMIRSMLALCSLAVEDGDAESYALQAQMLQADLARRAEERGLASAATIYQPLALAPYLRGVLREASMHDYDDAIRAYQLVSHLEPRFAPAQSDIQRCMTGIHSPPGHGVLYIIALVGRGPILEPVDAETTTAALQIASQVQSIASNDRLRLPNLVSVKVPKVVVPYSPAEALSVDSSGVWLGATQPLVDIGSMAVQQCEAEMPWTVARAIVRRVTKEIAVSQTTKAVGMDGVGRELATFAAVNTWSLTEEADTRCWGLLPREVQVLRAELPKGTHRIGLTVVGPVGNKVGPTRFADVEIRDGRNCYLTVTASNRDAFVVQ